ncbi:MAG: hypothetical protein ACKOBW_03295 [Planctomycetota bacterium]
MTGLAWLGNQLQAHVSRPITYRRGAQQVALHATLGRKDFEADSAEVRLYFRASDFLLWAADLVVGGQVVLPDRGDVIETELAGTVATFEVLAQDGVPPWEYCDPHGLMLRIHTKRTA